MSKLEDKTLELLDKFENLAEQYTPEVVDGALGAISVTAVDNLVEGVIFSVLAYICFFIARTLNRSLDNKIEEKLKEESEKSYKDARIEVIFDTDKSGKDCCMLFLFGAISVIFFIVALTTLLDVWNWVSIFNPKLGLAHQVLGL